MDLVVKTSSAGVGAVGAFSPCLWAGGRACVSSVMACEQLSRVLLVSLNQESLDTQCSQHRPET